MDARAPTVAVIYHFFAHYREPIIERLARSGVAKFVFIGDDHDYENSIKGGTFSSAVDLRPAPTRRVCRSWMWQKGVLGAAWSKEFDQVIFLGNAYWVATWLGAIVARLRGKRVLFWSHGFLKPPAGASGWLRRVFFSLAHGHLFYGDRAKANAVALGWDPTRIHVVRNSLDSDLQANLREATAQAATDAFKAATFKNPALPVAYCSCRLQPGKKLELLLSALAILARNGTPANAIIVGDGPRKAELVKMAGESGLDVHFEGACYDERRLALLNSASTVTVSPGFVGLTAIHSMIYGVPVITTDRSFEQAPEVEAITIGLTGDLFSDGDAEDLARVMRPWLSGTHDRVATRAACIATVERCWSPAYQQAVIEAAVVGKAPSTPTILASTR